MSAYYCGIALRRAGLRRPRKANVDQFLSHACSSTQTQTEEVSLVLTFSSQAEYADWQAKGGIASAATQSKIVDSLEVPSPSPLMVSAIGLVAIYPTVNFMNSVAMPIVCSYNPYFLRLPPAVQGFLQCMTTVTLMSLIVRPAASSGILRLTGESHLSSSTPNLLAVAAISLVLVGGVHYGPSMAQLENLGQRVYDDAQVRF